jgi:hypothetical protein
MKKLFQSIIITCVFCFSCLSFATNVDELIRGVDEKIVDNSLVELDEKQLIDQMAEIKSQFQLKQF